jgi:hypothetical protein
MKLFIEKLTEDLFGDGFLSQLDNVSIKDCLQYTSYGFFIGAIIFLLQGELYQGEITLLIAVFLKL